MTKFYINKNPSKIARVMWRRLRDSNSRLLAQRRFSRPVLSTAQPNLRDV